MSPMHLNGKIVKCYLMGKTANGQKINVNGKF